MPLDFSADRNVPLERRMLLQVQILANEFAMPLLTIIERRSGGEKFLPTLPLRLKLTWMAFMETLK
jgi:hypothetical protein